MRADLNGYEDFFILILSEKREIGLAESVAHDHRVPLSLCL